MASDVYRANGEVWERGRVGVERFQREPTGGFRGDGRLDGESWRTG